MCLSGYTEWHRITRAAELVERWPLVADRTDRDLPHITEAAGIGSL
jgi:hypothetical protein